MTVDLDNCGFIHVRCGECANPDVWLKCNTCDKSDHFLLENKEVVCTCTTRYDHASCLCGAEVPGADLVFTPFKEGPMTLADLELDPSRLAASATIVCVVLAILYVSFV